MGLRDTLKPRAPYTLSIDIMNEAEVDALSTGIHVDNAVGTNPEHLLIQLENEHISSTHREALIQVTLRQKPE